MDSANCLVVIDDRYEDVWITSNISLKEEFAISLMIGDLVNII